MANTQNAAEMQQSSKPVESFVAHDARNLYQLYLDWVKQGRPRRVPAAGASGATPCPAVASN